MHCSISYSCAALVFALTKSAVSRLLLTLSLWTLLLPEINKIFPARYAMLCKISNDLSSNYLKFIVKSTYVSDLRRANISLREKTNLRIWQYPNFWRIAYFRSDITRRIGLASSAMSSLRNIWNTKRLSIRTKLRVYQTLVLSVLL